MANASMTLVAALLVVAAQLPLGLTFSSTAPAFLWSPHLDGKKESVDYRILAPRDLAKSAMTEGGWSKFLCSGQEAQQFKTFAFLFIGTELHSKEISTPSKSDSALIDLLKDSFSNSNTSLAFPYVAAGEEKVSIESSLISKFSETCEHNLGISSTTLVGSCSVDGEDFNQLHDIYSLDDYMKSRIEKVSNGNTDLIVVCPGSSLLLQDSDERLSESGILSQLLNSVNQLGAKYMVLYISDPFRSTESLSHRGVQRFLTDGTMGNGSAKSTVCDGVCQIKSSLLEGILVGIVLLIILISGLCCMMGIDTPTRFEAPQDS